jgi:hypothetical protein
MCLADLFKRSSVSGRISIGLASLVYMCSVKPEDGSRNKKFFNTIHGYKRPAVRDKDGKIIAPAIPVNWAWANWSKTRALRGGSDDNDIRTLDYFLKSSAAYTHMFQPAKFLLTVWGRAESATLHGVRRDDGAPPRKLSGPARP